MKTTKFNPNTHRPLTVCIHIFHTIIITINTRDNTLLFLLPRILRGVSIRTTRSNHHGPSFQFTTILTIWRVHLYQKWYLGICWWIETGVTSSKETTAAYLHASTTAKRSSDKNSIPTTISKKCTISNKWMKISFFHANLKLIFRCKLIPYPDEPFLHLPCNMKNSYLEISPTFHSIPSHKPIPPLSIE